MSSRSRVRLLVLRVLVLSLLATLLGRLWYLQVLNSATYQRAAADNQLREIVTAPARGLVLDDVGRPLARNRTALVVSVDRVALLRQRDGGTGVLHRLAVVLHMSYPDVKARTTLCGPTVHPPCWNGSPYQPIPVTDRADPRQALQILERHEEFAGVTARLAGVRLYPEPDRSLAAHLLGYLGPISQAELARLSASAQAAHRNDLVGRSGLEAAYDALLRGMPGVQTVSVDHLGAVTGVVRQTAPVPGDDVVSSIDAGVQADVERALAHAVAYARSQGKPTTTASAVVLDAQTGHVVALASYPSYDPNLFVGGISSRDYHALSDPAHGLPLIDRATAGEYAPGSTFKLISTVGVLHEGTASLSGIYDCPPFLMVGNMPKGNFEGESFGYIDLHTTIVKSCDTVYYGFALHDYAVDHALVAAHRKPVEGVQNMARHFGLGALTGIDLPGEAPGYIEDRATKYKSWLALRKDYCKGARTRPKGSYLQALDAEDCQYGYIYNPGDQANFDIGQGTVLVTPLQLATAYAALVNGGVVYSPRAARAILSPSGRLVRWVNAPVRGRLDVPAEWLSYIQAAMYDVPKVGTASGAFLGFPFNKVAVGGKTGTADVYSHQPTSWFASFAGPPGQRARYAAVVMVPDSGQGALFAAPAMREIWDGIFGVEGHRAALPGGRLPTRLPTIAPDGTVQPVPSLQALGGTVGGGLGVGGTPAGPGAGALLTAAGLSATLPPDVRLRGTPSGSGEAL